MAGLEKSRWNLWASITVACGLATASPAALAKGGGNVLPPKAKPHGYSLTDMTKATALFNTSGNDLQYYPDTPFQILYVDPSTISIVTVNDGPLEIGGNSFTVAAGTPFYVPLANFDDSPPIFGTFPMDAKGAAGYFFDEEQLGCQNFAIIVDGNTTPVGPAYVAGPVTTPLLDGPGTHIINLGVFLTPLSPGTHTVTIQGQLTGDALAGFFFPPFQFTYTVTVQ